MKLTYSLTIIVCLLASVSAYAEVTRWYTTEQASQGQQIYQDKCAKCHGDNAQGEINWRRLDDEGEFPPPPLNGDAYAWHLNMDQLRHQILFGSDAEEGDMPSFRSKLDDGQVDAVIAFFQSQWNDFTYVLWYSRQRQDFTIWATSSGDLQQPAGTRWLKQHYGTAEVMPGEPLKTPVKGISEVRIGDEYIYLSQDGQYAFTGHMLDLRTGTNLTYANRAIETKRLLQTYPLKDMLVYNANGREKTHLTIFTDTTCGYCRKMHLEVPKLQSSGVTVRLIPYPRRGLDSKGYNELKLIWCAEHPGVAMDEFAESRQLPNSPESCQEASSVDAGYLLGNTVGVSATPMLILENGHRIRGFRSADNLVARMSKFMKDE